MPFQYFIWTLSSPRKGQDKVSASQVCTVLYVRSPSLDSRLLFLQDRPGSGTPGHRLAHLSARRLAVKAQYPPAAVCFSLITYVSVNKESID